MSAIPFERPRLPALTSVRFFAALWVALFHMQAMKAFYFGLAPVRQFASIGYCGVSFFFVLSGFILVYTYEGRATSLRDFWQARFARIYPALAFCLLITAPGFFYCCVRIRAHDPFFLAAVPEWVWIGPHMWLAAILSITLLESWIPQAALAWNMPNWSLSVEAFFYFIFPFLLPRLTRLSRRQLMAIVPAGWLVGIACTLAYMHFHPDGAAEVTTKTVGPWINAIKYHPLMRLPEFLMGMAGGLLFLRSERNQKLAWPMILAGLGAIGVVVGLSSWIPYLTIHTALLAPAFAAIIYGIALRPAGLGMLENRMIEAFGEASYPFYLLHSMVISSVFVNWQNGTVRHQTLAGFAMWFLIAVGIALLVDRFIERPLRRLLRPRKKPVEATPLPVPAEA
ncbi:MAG: acyltransferase [Terracidiphilus sp.]|jgi:peptidoglycan/LPS O-acetylase OafA/YrhL